MKKLVYLLLIVPSLVLSQCFSSVSCGQTQTLFLKLDGTLSYSGDYNGTIYSTVPLQLGSDVNWYNVSTGQNYILALKNDNTLWGKGAGGYGQFGNGSGATFANFTQIGTANDWIFVSCGNVHTLALKNNHTLWTTGSNQYGQLGDGTTTNKNIFTQIGTNDWLKIEAGSANSFGIKIDGTLWAWGVNNYGQLGDGTNVNKLIPTQIGSDNDWQTISSNTQHTLALKNNGTLWSWGYNNAGQLGNGTFGVISGVSNTNLYSATPTQVGTDSDWAKVASCYNSSIALKQNGTLWTWGSDGGGVLGDGTSNNNSRNTPILVGTATDWMDIQAGQGFVHGVKTDNNLYSWGYNSSGQLGLGDTTTRYSPTLLSNCTLATTTFQKNTFTLYPNPTTNVLNIDNNNSLIQKVKIIDMLGKQVLEQNQNTTSLNVGSLQKGLYIVQIYSDESVFNLKFVKE